MDIRNFRIGDYLKLARANDDSIYQAIALYDGQYVDLRNIENSNIYIPSLDVQDVVGVPITDAWLKSINAEYDTKTVKYTLSLATKDKISIRPQNGEDNYMLSVIGRYKSPYKKVTYIHELQHWLWDLFQATI